MAKKRISMDDMCGGALLQRFNMEMAKIGRNIMDPNTDPRKPRKLTISLTFKADESRKSLTTSIRTSSSLAPLEPINTIMLAGQDIRTGQQSTSRNWIITTIPCRWQGRELRCRRKKSGRNRHRHLTRKPEKFMENRLI